MSRMKCIGAQSIPFAVIASPPPLGIETPCRRDSDADQLHTFFKRDNVDASAATTAQIPLFEEPVHCV